MTTYEESLPSVPEGEAVIDAQAVSTWLERVDGWMRRLGDHLNPILVKEARQALKSKQFSITFALLLACGWVWSILATAIVGYGSYGGQGAMVFYGYLQILAFPLFVIVPFGAYRSLASEWEDGTYELMSISMLNARQIVSGKLGSAVLQMLVYLSAISPCLAFTYLLRGIDLLTIFYLLGWALAISLSATVLSLCMATLTRSRHWQVMVSVVLIAGCLFLFFVVSAQFTGMILFEYFGNFFVYDEPWFWIATACWLSYLFAGSVLFFLIARARLLFVSENRSTAIRYWLVAIHLLSLGWFGWLWLFEEGASRAGPEMLTAVLAMMGGYWWAMGTFLTGEDAELSQRVKRDLPQSFLGRVLLTWFNPGAGTGYVFVLGNLLSVMLLAFAAVALARMITPQITTNWRASELESLWMTGVLGFSYVVIYLGAGRLLITLLRRVADVSLLLNVLIHLLLVLAGAMVPWVIAQLGRNAPNFGRGEYTLLQAFNWFWTLVEVNQGTPPTEIWFLMVILPLTAALFFLGNLPAVAQEVRQLRVSRPKRVEEEDAVLHPEPEVETYKSPWD